MSEAGPAPATEILEAFLLGTDLIRPGEAWASTVLPGGVSCDVWRIDAVGRSFCVKRALPRLRVEALWEAPVARNAHEWAWISFAARTVPGSVPRLLAHDPERAMFAMEYLEPARFPVWKQLLLDGTVSGATARSTASVLARLHTASAGNGELASKFRTGGAFHDLRIEPYLLEAARRNPAVSEVLQELARKTLATQIALVHGDVSPKNILVGAEGPVFLDAETAWYGDPAFDLAFCLNHLLLKCLARPILREQLLDCFAEFRSAYLTLVSWENALQLEGRAARLLPALLLARVDGKSPVEYLTGRDRSFVRETACGLILAFPDRLDGVAQAWRAALTRNENNFPLSTNVPQEN